MAKRRKKPAKSSRPVQRKKSPKPSPRKPTALQKALRKLPKRERALVEKALRKRPLPKPKSRKRAAPKPKPRKHAAPKPKRIDPKRSKAAKKGAETRKKRSIRYVAHALHKISIDPRYAEHFPRSISKLRALGKAKMMTSTQRNLFLKDPSFENLQDLAEDPDNEINVGDGDKVNPFWYH